MSDLIRNKFEEHNPVPDGVFWDGEKYKPSNKWRYRYDKPRTTRLAKKHNKLLGVWQDAIQTLPGMETASTLAESARRLHNLANHHCSDKGEWFTDRPENFEALREVEQALVLYRGEGD